MSRRDEKINEILRGIFDVEDTELKEDFVSTTVMLVDLKQALQLAYKAGQEAKES